MIQYEGRRRKGEKEEEKEEEEEEKEGEEEEEKEEEEKEEEEESFAQHRPVSEHLHLEYLHQITFRHTASKRKQVLASFPGFSSDTHICLESN